MKRWLTGILAAGCLFISPQISDAQSAEVPKDTYQWVQSTARANYYFNKKAICYGVDEKGIIDMNTLIVPTVQTYDNVQIQDVISKRRWNMISTEGYESLVGTADYLLFKIAEGTVQVTEHQDLDRQWGVLDSDTSGTPIKVDSFSEKSVEGKFYRAILKYAEAHKLDVAENTKGEFSKEDQKLIEKLKKEREEQEKKALKEKEKREKAEQKEREKREKEERKAQKEKEKTEKTVKEQQAPAGEELQKDAEK